MRLIDRVEKYIKLDRSGCWRWTASDRISVKTPTGVCSMIPSRLIYMLNGTDPTGKQLVRTCTTKTCVNPTHLTLGSQTDVIKLRRSRKKNRWDEFNYRSNYKTKDLIHITFEV